MLKIVFRKVVTLVLLLSALPSFANPLEWPVNDEVLDQTSAQIRSMVAASRAIRIEKSTLVLPAQVRRFYQQRDFRPVWFDRCGVLLEAGDLLQVLKKAETEGLPEHGYPLATIEGFLTGHIEESRQLAQLDLLLTDTFLHYSRSVRSGRIGPHSSDDDWFLSYTPFDGSQLLLQGVTECSLGEVLATLPPPHAGYRRLRTALQQYRALAAQGGWPRISPGETLQMGSQGLRVVELRERLRVTGDLQEKAWELPERFDEELSEAVHHFQRRHGLEADGRVGRRTLEALNVPVEARIRQIEINMERWRWMPREMPSRYLQVNMAGYELDLFESEVAVMNMRVIVGRHYRQTPVFASEVTSIVLNPYWYVPRRIFREDLLPTFRKDPARFNRLKMRLLSAGNEVNNTNIDWSSVDGYSFPYTLRQEPGLQNALGRIKFLLPNSYGIYLHDTPDRHLFERTTRAFSSGCIRLEQPLRLAQYLLATPEQWSEASLVEAIDTGTQRTLKLPEALPIYFTYWTAWVDPAGVVQLRDDIYSRDRRLLKLWEKSAT